MSKVSHSVAGSPDPLPEVLFVEDVAALLRCSSSTVRRRLRGGVFPVPTLPGVDKRPRFSRAAFMAWLERGGRLKR